MPILIGPGGIGKSTALSTLLPEAHRDRWFSDSFNFRAEDKVQIEALVGPVIIEVAEMRGALASDIGAMKALISRQFDRGRMAYGRKVDVYPRRGVLVGTSDKLNALPNDENSRRFVPIAMGQPVASLPALLASLVESRDQLWAEAKRKYEKRTGDYFKDVWNDQLTVAQQKMIDAHRDSNELTDDMVSHLSPCPGGAQLTTLMHNAGCEDRQRRDFIKSLGQFNWVTKRMSMGGQRGRYWVSPSGWEAAPYDERLFPQANADFETIT